MTSAAPLGGGEFVFTKEEGKKTPSEKLATSGVLMSGFFEGLHYILTV